MTYLDVQLQHAHMHPGYTMVPPLGTTDVSNPATGNQHTPASQPAVVDVHKKFLSKNYLPPEYELVDPFASIGNGWSDLATKFREMDGKKMDNHVKDIDTALVFTGLFSAVLTAFLLETISDLRPPSQDITTRLMHQTTLQAKSYSIGSGNYLNTTYTLDPLPILDSFQPSLNAVSVNIIWFSGLTLSLITASLAILVKQWLREHVTDERTSPQEFFRLRHFRNQGFEDWGVFEIVAIVYLLQQVYLALFLVGLCLYTGGVQNATGRTTTILVIVWGLVVFIAVVAPAFSPHCPYRTSLLIRGIESLRRVFASIIHSVSKQPGAPTPSPPTRPTDIPQQTQTKPPSWLQRFTRPTDTSPPTGSTDTPQQPQPKPPSWLQRYSGYLKADDKSAITRTDRDISILCQMDAHQKDSHLLSHIWDALQPGLDIDSKKVESVDCIIAIFDNHSETPKNHFHDLKHLPYSAVEPAIIMIAELYMNILEPNETEKVPKTPVTTTSKLLERSKEMTRAIVPVVTQEKPMPEYVKFVLLRLLTTDNFEKFVSELVSWMPMDAKQSPDPQVFSDVVKRLRPALVWKNATVPVAYVLDTLYQRYFKKTMVEALLGVNGSCPLERKHVKHIMELLTERLRKWTMMKTPARWPTADANRCLTRLVNMLLIAWDGDSDAIQYCSESLVSILQRLFEHSHAMLTVCLCLFGPTESQSATQLALNKGRALFVNAVVTASKPKNPVEVSPDSPVGRYKVALNYVHRW